MALHLGQVMTMVMMTLMLMTPDDEVNDDDVLVVHLIVPCYTS